MTSIMVVGIGSPHGDDQAGWLVVEHLKRHSLPAGFQCAATPVDLLHWLDGVDLLLVCDAFLDGAVAPDGGVDDLNRLSLGGDCSAMKWAWPLTSDVAELDWRGTHDMSLIQCLRLAEALGALPAQVELWGVKIQEPPRPLEPLSEIVERRAKLVAEAIATRILSLNDEAREGSHA